MSEVCVLWLISTIQSACDAVDPSECHFHSVNLNFLTFSICLNVSFVISLYQRFHQHGQGELPGNLLKSKCRLCKTS